MRTNILFSILFLLITGTATAQFDLGIKAGVNLNKIDGVAFSDQFKYGYHAGGFATIWFGKKFGVQPELLYSQNSMRVDSSFTNALSIFQSDLTNVRLNYITIPILLNYKLIGKFLTFQAGPQFGILIDQSRNLLQNGGDAFKRGDFSLTSGLQLKVGALRLNGRYIIGLNNISEIANNTKWKGQTVQISAGFAIL